MMIANLALFVSGLSFKTFFSVMDPQPFCLLIFHSS